MALTSKEKQDNLKAALDRLEKSYGKGCVVRLEDAPIFDDVEVISTGSLGLDLALGIGGFPKGRVVEVYGPESSGKTTVTLHAIAECQKQGGTAAFLDLEHALDLKYCESLGVNTKELIFSQPDYGEQALEIAEGLIKSGSIDIIVIDSVAALVPKAELEGEMGESKLGLHARLMSQALRKLTGVISRTGCCCIFINQLREKIGIQFGSPEVTTGGNALKFYASVRLDVRRTVAPLKDKEGDASGNRTKVKVVKNKMAPPFKIAEFDIIYGKGISKAGELVDIGSELGIVSKSGSWFAMDGVKLGQGRDAAIQMVEDNVELGQEIEAKVKDFLNKK